MRSSQDLGSARGRFGSRGLAAARLLALLAVACVAGAAWAAEPPAELTRQIDQVFAEFDKPDSPGCAVAVVRHGQVIHKRGYGIANLDYGLPIESDSTFYLASVSKQFTAACIALLAQEGKLSLDDPVRKHVPELPEYEGGPITVRQMVHHTSGLRDYLTLTMLAGGRFEDVHSDKEILALIARQQETNFRPGDEYLYSNTGYYLLSVIVERVSGKSLREFADEKIFQPLGMHHTHFHDDRSEIVKNRVISYLPDGDGFKISYLANFDKVGSGGLLSTLDDLVLWANNFDDNRVGSAGFLDMMTTLGKLNDGTELEYAFGLSLGQYKGLATVGHGGAMMGFRTHLVRFPDQRTSIIVLSNLGTTNPEALAHRVADIVLRDEFSQQLQHYAGEYRSAELDAAYRIDVEGADLLLDRVDGTAVKLAPLGDAHAFRLESGIEVRFIVDESGSVTGCTVGAGRARAVRFEKTAAAEAR